MFSAYYKDSEGELRGPVDIYQILRSSSFPSGHEAILYNHTEAKWIITDLDNIVSPTRIINYNVFP